MIANQIYSEYQEIDTQTYKYTMMDHIVDAFKTMDIKSKDINIRIRIIGIDMVDFADETDSDSEIDIPPLPGGRLVIYFSKNIIHLDPAFLQHFKVFLRTLSIDSTDIEYDYENINIGNHIPFNVGERFIESVSRILYSIVYS